MQFQSVPVLVCKDGKRTRIRPPRARAQWDRRRRAGIKSPHGNAPLETPKSPADGRETHGHTGGGVLTLEGCQRTKFPVRLFWLSVVMKNIMFN